MIRIFYSLGGILFLFLLRESFGQRSFWRELRRQNIPNEFADQRLLAVPYEETPRYWLKDTQERRNVEESRPLCEEERKSQDIREYIQTSGSNFVQSGNELDLRKYHLIPRKIDVIRCVLAPKEDETSAICKPENCRERKVDVEVFGRLRNETGNVWEFVGTLSAVPVACECFVRWRPQKCSRSEVFTRN